MEETLSYVNNITSNISTSDVNTNIHIHYWEKIFTGIIISFISVSGLVGNAMIIAAVAFSRKLQTSTNAFVVNLSVADFLTSFFLIWYIVSLLGDNRWPLPNANWICALTAFMLFECSCVGLYTMATIAIDRLIRITKPVLYKRMFTPWKIGIFVAATWIIPLMSISAALGTKTGEFGYDKLDGTCSDVDTHEKADLFNMAQTIVALPIPFTIIAISYTLIYVYLKKHFKKTKHLFSPPATSISVKLPDDTILESSLKMSFSEAGQPSDNNHDNQAEQNAGQNTSSNHTIRASFAHCKDRVTRQEIQITKNLFVVVSIYLFCFAPFLIAIAIPFSLSGHVVFYIRIPYIASCAVNIAIYARKHPHFKLVLKHLLTCSYDKIPQPSTVLKFLLTKKQ